MAWPKGRPRPKKQPEGAATEPPFSIPATDEGIVMQTQEVPAPKPPVKMHAVRLLRNYRPAGPVEIVGWHKDAVRKKSAAGVMVEVSPAEFIRGEMKPAPYPGVGFPGKIWAGTVVKLTEDEARSVKKQRIGELEFDS